MVPLARELDPEHSTDTFRWQHHHPEWPIPYSSIQVPTMLQRLLSYLGTRRVRNGTDPNAEQVYMDGKLGCVY